MDYGRLCKKKPKQLVVSEKRAEQEEKMQQPSRMEQKINQLHADLRKKNLRVCNKKAHKLWWNVVKGWIHNIGAVATSTDIKAVR
jgi:hypothetical protein